MVLKDFKRMMRQFAVLLFLIPVLNCRGDRNCDWGLYGENCNLTCPEKCSVNDERNLPHCQKESGKCSDGCTHGWHGDQCNNTCRETCPDNVCNQGTGHCTYPCDGETTGPFCENPKESTTQLNGEEQSNNVATIVAPVIFGIIIIIIIIITIVIVIYIKRRQKSTQNRPPESPKETDKLTEESPKETDKLTEESPNETDKLTEESPKETDKLTEESPKETDKLTEGMCQCCLSVETEYIELGIDGDICIIHAVKSIITGPRKKKKIKLDKKEILGKIKKKVSALMNTNGGSLIVHLDGQEKGDINLVYFTEFVNKTLKDLAESESSFDDTYCIKWLHETQHFNTFYDVLLIKVAKACGISTVHFNTKICNDTNQTISRLDSLLAHSRYEDSCAPPVLRGIHQDILQLRQESPNTDLKVFCLENDISQVQYIWEDLKLKDSITYMSKCPGGGSCYVGVEREDEVFRFVGFPVNNPEELQTNLRKKVQEELCVLSFTGEFGDPPSDLVTVKIHSLSGEVDKCVLELAVRFFRGIVFYDKQGPITYEIQNHGICRMERTEWLKKFKQLPKWKEIKHGGED